jgi:hypothetical protein
MMDLLNKLRPGFTVHGFRRASRIGRLNTIIRKSFARWRLCIPSAIRLSKLIGAVRGSTKGAT